MKTEIIKLDFHYKFSSHTTWSTLSSEMDRGSLWWTVLILKCKTTPNTTEWFITQWLHNDKPAKYVLWNIRNAHRRERLLTDDLDSKQLTGSWFMWPQTRCTWTHIFSLTNLGSARMLFPSVWAICLSELTYTGAIYLFSFCKSWTECRFGFMNWCAFTRASYPWTICVFDLTTTSCNHLIQNFAIICTCPHGS